MQFLKLLADPLYILSASMKKTQSFRQRSLINERIVIKLPYPSIVPLWKLTSSMVGDRAAAPYRR